MNKVISLASPLKRIARSISLGVSGGERNTAALPKPKFGCSTVQRSECSNGMKVAAGQMSGAPFVSCTVMFQAGSRNEVDDELGVTHFLRAGSVTSAPGFSGYMKSRFLQQLGGYLIVSTDRETVAYTLRCPFDAFQDLKNHLVFGCVRCNYPSHELDKAREMIRGDLQRRSEAEHAIDLVQKACFIGPVANSIHCEKGRVDTITSSVLNNYVATFFNPNNCAMASQGLPFDVLMQVAEDLESNAPARAKCVEKANIPRGGYEYYDLGPGGDTYFALAVPGVGTENFQNCIKHAILAASFGQGSMQDGTHSYVKTLQPPLGQLVDDPFTEIKAFNISYTDTGCWGILTKTRSECAQHTAQHVVKFFKKLDDLHSKQIEVGKARLKLGVMLSDDKCDRASENLALKLMNNVYCDSAAQLCSLIDSTKDEEVKSVGKALSSKCIEGQLALAVVGDASTLNDIDLLSA